MTASIVDASVGFAEALRRAGLSVGVADTLDFVRALELLDISRRADVRAASRAVFVRRHEDAARHDAVFDAYWRERRDPGRNDAEWAGARGQTSSRAAACRRQRVHGKSQVAWFADLGRVGRGAVSRRARSRARRTRRTRSCARATSSS